MENTDSLNSVGKEDYYYDNNIKIKFIHIGLKKKKNHFI